MVEINSKYYKKNQKYIDIINFIVIVTIQQKTEFLKKELFQSHFYKHIFWFCLIKYICKFITSEQHVTIEQTCLSKQPCFNVLI